MGFHGGPALRALGRVSELGQPLPPRSVQGASFASWAICGCPMQRTEPGAHTEDGGDAATSQCLGDSKKGILGPKGNRPSPAGPGTRIVGTLGLEGGHALLTRP